VQRSSKGHAPEESEAILECREFSAEQLREMIATEEIRDANTLAMFARLHCRGILF
jgi:hypothetical protein